MICLYKILKKDGSVQDYDPQKLVNSVVNAGGTAEQGQEVASLMEPWLSQMQESGVESIQSQELKSEVASILRGIDPGIAATYETFIKS